VAERIGQAPSRVSGAGPRAEVWEEVQLSVIHDQTQTLLAAYGIGAVPEQELPELRAHILGCEKCFAEAECLACSIEVLYEVVEPLPLPKGFEQRVMKAAVRGQRAPGASRRVRLPSPRALILAGAVGMMTATFLLFGIARIDSVDHQSRYLEALSALISDPDALTLHGPGGSEAVLASSVNGSVLVVVNLGEAPRDHRYQLWLMRDGVPKLAGTFDVSDSVTIVESIESLAEYDGAAVSLEPEGGSSQPTTEPVLATS